MKYELDNGHFVNIPDADIERLQKTLNISYNEAVYTWLVDEEYFTDETVEELSNKAKKSRITATVHQAKSADKKKDRKPREKKENPIKKEIIKAIFNGLKENLSDTINIIVSNDEKYIEIHGYDKHFTVNLVQHREKKEK